jgi:hypothetical protein
LQKIKVPCAILLFKEKILLVQREIKYEGRNLHQVEAQIDLLVSFTPYFTIFSQVAIPDDFNILFIQ